MTFFRIFRILAFGMWNTIEERVSYECYIDLLLTQIVFSSSGTFSSIKSNMKSSFNSVIPIILIQKKKTLYAQWILSK